MTEERVHSFHIPVLGLVFSVDTPIRVARFGISSVVSIVDDVLMERMRRHYSALHNIPFTPIGRGERDSRARRITAYLNLVQTIVRDQVARLKASAFDSRSELTRYFELLSDTSPLKALYRRMIQTSDPRAQLRLQEDLRSRVVPGSIDVNIMTKLDKANKDTEGEACSDAVAALRGFAGSELHSAVVFSAGFNPRLYSYLGNCREFFPDDQGRFLKRVILKVSDYRSALIQGRFLARKGIWISEYRIESGLNCGGHAFATEGLLLGPILETFKEKREELLAELYQEFCKALAEKGRAFPGVPPPVRISVQGGIGTALEDRFLREYHGVDGTGWGSPFLLVPEATNMDAATRSMLAAAKPEDFYLSDSSPLGVPFNNLRGSYSEQEKLRKVALGKPGSPCTKKYLVSNTEFTAEPICTASIQYQSQKIKQLREAQLPPDVLRESIDAVTAKSCLCEGLSSCREGGDSAVPPAVAVCPGPNLAFFSKISSLEEMVGHIYGRVQLLSASDRPNMFVNELRLYADYLKQRAAKKLESFSEREQKSLEAFRASLLDGISYYKSLIPKLKEEGEAYRERMHCDLQALELELLALVVPVVGTVA